MSPSPHPADLVEPTPDRLRGDVQAVLELEGLGQGGTAPARAAPAIAPGGSLEQGEQSALEPRHQHRGAQRRQEVALVVVTEAERAVAIGSHDAVDAGARTEQDRKSTRLNSSHG